MDLQQIWELAQRLLEEGRDRSQVEARVAELTQQATGHPLTLGQLETSVQAFPGEAAAQKTLRALLATPAVVRAAPKLVVRAMQAAFDLPETIVDYLADNTPEEVAEDLASGVGAAAEFIAEDVGEFGPGVLLEGVGPIGRVGKVSAAGRQLKKGVSPGSFPEGLSGGAQRILKSGRATLDPDFVAKELERQSFRLVDNPDQAVYLLSDGRMYGNPTRRMFGHNLEDVAEGLGMDPRALGTIRFGNFETRLAPGRSMHLDMNQPPTPAQSRIIRQVVKDADGQIVTHVDTPGGSFKVEAERSRQVLNDINKEMDTIFEADGVAARQAAEQADRGKRLQGRGLPIARQDVIDADDTSRLIRQLTDDFGGSTVDPRTGRSLTGEDRWAVSIGPDFEQVSSKPLTETGVQEFIRKHQTYLDENPDVMVGTWFDEANQRWEINLTKTFDSQRDARNFGASNNQRAIMNLADPEFEAVKVGDSFANARLRMRLDNTLDHRQEARLSNFRNALDEGELKVWDGMSNDMKQGTLDVYSLMPEAEEGAALALVGAEAARWYQESARPIFEMFGTDAPRFLAMTAALSPNAPVDKAFWAGLDMWADWVQAGRPKNREWVEQTLGRLKKEYGVTPTNANNVERLLNVSDEALLEPGALERGGIFGKAPIGAGLGTKGATTFLSGMKIDPFWGNLNGQLQRYVMDTHMKNVTGFMAQASASKRQVIGATASARDQAKFLTDLTGKTWTAAEVQAAQWSVVKSIKEMALEGVAVGKRGGQTKKVPRMLKELTGIPEGLQWTDEVPATGFGELSERIRNTPSLQRYLHADEAKPHLARIGIEPPPLSENLSKLDFLDDPSVRFGDVMDAMIRIAQSNGQSLPAVAAMLVSQGVINKVQGAELLDAIGAAAGLDDVSQAAEADPAATVDALQLLDEVPDASEETIRLLGAVRGRPGMENVARILRGGNQAAPAEPGNEEPMSAEALRDSVTQIAGGGRFTASHIPDLLDFLMPKEDIQTAGIVFDLPFLRGRANIDPEFIDNREIVAHEGGHVVENLAPEEAAGINAALDNFLSGLDPSRRDELAGEVVNRPPTDEALREELFANLFREELLTPEAPPSVEGTGNVRQLFRQMIDRKINFPGIGE